jgi:hypothetical protein
MDLEIVFGVTIWGADKFIVKNIARSKTKWQKY